MRYIPETIRPLLPVYIVSAERGNLSKQKNTARTAKLRAILTEEGAAWYPAFGSWEGKLEASTVVVTGGGLTTARATRGLIDRLALLFMQDAVLYVDARRQAYLLPRGKGKRQALGRLLASSNQPNTPGFTYVPRLRTYYYTAR